jgi:hypothetical protein
MGFTNNNRKNKNANINREPPDGLNPCCFVRGQRCVCLPYDDVFMITAQILSIVCVFVSWIWWITFIISIIGMTMIQIIWCCRQNNSMLLTSAAVAVVSALVSVGVGIYILIVWNKKRYCYPWIMDTYDPYYDPYYSDEDYCEETKWSIIAFVCGVLWSLVSVCIVHFVTSGRHARWEKHHAPASREDGDAGAVVELGTVPEASLPVAAAAVAMAITLPEPSKADRV